MNIDSLQDLRDVTIVAFTIAGTIVFIVGLGFMLVLGVVAIRLMSSIRNTLENSVTPVFNSFRQTADNVRGTTAFIADTAVSPIIRVYSVFKGVRKALSVLVGLGRR